LTLHKFGQYEYSDNNRHVTKWGKESKMYVNEAQDRDYTFADEYYTGLRNEYYKELRNDYYNELRKDYIESIRAEYLDTEE
jgi:hypothetical protein